MDEVPENVAEVLQQGIYVPDDQSPEAMLLYQRALEGKCMLCDSETGEGTTVIMNHLGVVMLFCSQTCLQDFLFMHGLMEIYDDMVSAAKFRNQKGNN